MYIWLNEHHIVFEYCPNIRFTYQTMNGKEQYYFPDFKIGNELYEIKGSHFFKNGKMICPYRKKEWSDTRYQEECEKYEAKYQCMLKNNVNIVLTSSICMKIIRQYIYDHYGKSYLKSFMKDKNMKK